MKKRKIKDQGLLTTRKGFTLVEVLVSASVLGIISLAVMTTFGSGLRVYERVQSYGSLQAEALLSLEEMERDLRSAFPLLTIPFEGEKQKVTFPAVTETVEIIEEEEQAVASIAKVSYFVRSDGEQNVLTRSYLDYSLSSSGEQSKTEKNSDMAYVKEVQFRYYFFDEETSEFGWKEDWSSEEGDIPSAVEIMLTYEDQGQEVELARTVLVPAVRVEQEEEDDEEEGEEGNEV